jgi:hypothetical protein
VPSYDYICKTLKGEQLRGECEAANENDLINRLRNAGLVVLSYQERSGTGGPPQLTRSAAFYSKVASALRAAKLLRDRAKTAQPYSNPLSWLKLNPKMSFLIISGLLAVLVVVYVVSQLDFSPQPKPPLEQSLVKQLEIHKGALPVE